jgi:D-alanyl-D-alanine carboxypeptidase
MLFAIGSITKNMVATLVLQLAQEGVLTLDDPIPKWLPAYPHIAPTITIRQLLNHTSGIYMFWSNQDIWDDLKKDRTKVWTPEEVLSYIKEPYFAPGDGYRYSNTNYLLLAMIIEKATGANLSTEFRERFWRKLGMENTYLSLEEDIPDNQAHVYGDNFNNDGSTIDLTFLPRASHESITYGSSGLFMTAENLARWSHALFAGEILQQQSMDEMLHYVKFRPVSNMRAYGLGVSVYTRSFSSGKEAIGHSGGNIGTTAHMVYLPEYHVSVAVMVNAFPNKSATVIAKGLIRTILREFNAIGVIPYFEFFPIGLIMVCGTMSLITMLVVRKMKRPKRP